MRENLPAVLGFGVIFLIVGGLGGSQLGLTASIIFLVASAALLAFGGITAIVAHRQRAEALGATHPAGAGPLRR
ncbi:hypothetical protein [Naasia sp. SYSU D00057]|uniref:hypothetical protein n=1 Tax=Naasia sp. SYSU D00057 TaxID=2817380 RepID=UPI001B313907|nr:hypothetical protein [Naasia sp. SYSU D00057]